MRKYKSTERIGIMLVEVKKIGKEEKVIVSSLDVADTFTYYDEEGKHYKREHKSVMRAIRELKCSERFRGENFSPSEYVDSRGKKQPCFLITKDGFALLVMGFNDPKSIEFKEGYIKQFNAMEEQLQGKYREREKGIAIRQALTKSLQLSQENERMHGHAYSNFTNVIYKTLFDKNAKQMREYLGIGPKDSIRDALSVEELKAVESMEHLVTGLVDCGWGYDAIKEFIQNNNTRYID